MPELRIELTQDSMLALSEQARENSTTPEGRAAHLLDLFLADTRRFPDGVIKAECLRVTAALARMPGISKTEWSGFAFRDWALSFQLDTSAPIAWETIRRLGAWINTETEEMGIRASLLPMPNLSPDATMRWAIRSTEPMFDPSELGQWLEKRLSKT